MLTCIGGALLGALVFLFARTETIDFRGDAQALSLLREMKDFDARRDSDALRLANDLAGTAIGIPDRGPAIYRIMRELEQGPARDAVAAQLPALRAGMAEKEAAYDTLKRAHAESMAAYKEADEALAALTAPAAGARARGSERASALIAIAERLRSALQNSDVETTEENLRELDRRAATLLPAALATDPFLAEPARHAEAALRNFSAARGREALAWRKLSFMTVGGRISLTASTLARSIENALDEKDRWRVYLFAYGIALVIGVGYLGVRTVGTLRDLRHANDDLERRSSERARDLAQTLRQLQDSESQLVQSEKMSSLGQLVAGVAHEINRPLGFVRSSLSNARGGIARLRELDVHATRLVELHRAHDTDPLDLDRAVATLAARLAQLRSENVLDDLEALSWDGLKGVEQVVELVANLKSFSRLDRSRVASFNVNDGVHAALLIAKPLLRKVDVEKSLGDVPSITCSPSQVNQVLLNLVTNAAQSIDKPRGRITVTTRHPTPGAIAIDIADNGKGIAAEALPRIFDPFFTTKESGQGTGLGLSIAHKIVLQHGGRIDVRSQVGVGSTFTVTLPLQPPPETGSHSDAAHNLHA